MQSRPVVLTGIRSNAELTLGNYLGAILPLISLQKKHQKDCQFNFFVPDLHSFITPVDHGTLYQNTINNIKILVACGLEIGNDSTYIYRQSYIPAHSELAWILDCFMYYGELSRMTQFKEKSDNQGSVSVGLFNYPALMAADILLYDATYVPVGDDQKQHLELTRNVAIRMNNQFKSDLFKVPAVWSDQLKFSGIEGGVRIRSLKHPEVKMSKSTSDPSGTILLSDNPKQAAEKIINATTDSIGKINLDYEKQPGVSNLLQIIALLSKRSLKDVLGEWDKKTSYTELKQVVAGLVETLLVNYQSKLSSVDDNSILTILTNDEASMNLVANTKLLSVQRSVGLRQ